jgi:hypothetical protein
VSVFVWIESCICVNTCFLCRIIFVCESVFRLHLVDWVLYGRALSLFVGGREREVDCEGVEMVGIELVVEHCVGGELVVFLFSVGV